MNASSNSAPDDVENAGLDMVVLAAGVHALTCLT
jgi:hypothetical protein